MPSYWSLSSDERLEVLVRAAQQTGRPPRVLEKDLWVCWVLQQLFSKDFGCPLAFKGGTSLSKVFGLIRRFSEDVDITVDHRPWGIDLGSGISKSKRKERFEQIHTRLFEFARSSLAPALQDTDLGVEVELDAGNDVKIFVKYRSVIQFEALPSYLREHVLVELGARNPIEPHQIHLVEADVAACFPNLEFPSAQVSVLSPIRTFWEKATLLHGAISANTLEVGAERLSRHWYDLSQLFSSPEWGEPSVNDLQMLITVAEDKERLFPAQKYRYPEARPGTLRLIPQGSALKNLEQDYRGMIDAGFFHEPPPPLADILSNLTELEARINRGQPGLE